MLIFVFGSKFAIQLREKCNLLETYSSICKTRPQNDRSVGVVNFSFVFFKCKIAPTKVTMEEMEVIESLFQRNKRKLY